MTADPVLKILQDQLEEAKRRHQQAKEHFLGTAGHPGVATQAEKQQRDALVRLNQYLIHGIIPEDLRGAGQR